MGGNLCAVGCGVQNGGDNSCPTGMTCQAIPESMGMPVFCFPDEGGPGGP
jgi:hypothetical protein